MAGSSIIITQTPHGSSAAGVAKRDLDIYTSGNEIEFTNFDNTGVQAWDWELLEKPPGSAATLTGATTAAADLQADVEGRYVVSLRVNGLGNDTSGYSVIVAGVSFAGLGSDPWGGGDTLGDWDPPAFLERGYANWTDFYGSLNTKGAQRELYRILYQLRKKYLPLLHTPQSVHFLCPWSDNYSQTTDQNTYQVAGYLPMMNFVDYPVQNIKMIYSMMRNGGSGTGSIRLYNVSDGELVTGTEMTTVGTPPVTVWSSALTIGTAAGNLKNNGNKNYRFEIKITGGTPAVDYMEIHQAGFYITY